MTTPDIDPITEVFLTILTGQNSRIGQREAQDSRYRNLGKRAQNGPEQMQMAARLIGEGTVRDGLNNRCAWRAISIAAVAAGNPFAFGQLCWDARRQMQPKRRRKGAKPNERDKRATGWR